MIDLGLPMCWTSTKFEELVLNSFTGLVRSASEQSAENEYAYLKMNNLSSSGKFELTNLVKVSATDSEVKKYTLQSGDFIFNTRNSVELVGKCGVFDAISTRPILFNNNLLKITFVHTDPKIIAHWLNSAFGKEQLKSITSATTSVAAIYQKQLMALNIPVIPLAEQKVIAAKLDELLAQVDILKTRLTTIPTLLKRFRQSVLAAAVSGKLTEEWRGGANYVVNEKSISQIAESLQVGIVRAATEQSNNASGGIPYFKMNNINSFWGWNAEAIVYVECGQSDIKKYELCDGDWLFNTRNSTELVGKSCVWSGGKGFIYNNNILRVRLQPEYCTKYLEVWFRSDKGRDQLGEIKSATTSVAAIYQKQLTNLLIEFPSYQEQTEIVRRVEQLFAFADQIEQQVKNAQSRVNNLTQSILAKAFRGELTADWRAANTHLITGENSAQALLAKIKSDKTKRKA